jgi:cell division protein FtsB
MDIRLKKLPKMPALPKPEDGIRALLERAPQAQQAIDRLADRFLPAWSVLYRVRRRIATGAVLALTAWVFLHVMFGANGMVVYKEKRAQIDELQKEVDALQLENQHFGEQIKNLKADPKTIEREAREALHYTRPGEVVYVAPPAVSTTRPATNSARK